MTKTTKTGGTATKQNHPTAEEIKHQVSETAEQVIDKKVADEIETILKANNRALQPFIQHTEVASIARVRLVRSNPDAENEVEKVSE